MPQKFSGIPDLFRHTPFHKRKVNNINNLPQNTARLREVLNAIFSAPDFCRPSPSNINENYYHLHYHSMTYKTFDYFLSKKGITHNKTDKF